MTKRVISAFGDLSDMRVCCTFMPGDRLRKLTEIAEYEEDTDRENARAVCLQIHKDQSFSWVHTDIDPSHGFRSWVAVQVYVSVKLMEFQGAKRGLCLVFLCRTICVKS